MPVTTSLTASTAGVDAASGDHDTFDFEWSGCRVRLGVLDENAVKAFTEGDCATFARVLAPMVGGRVVRLVEHPGTAAELTTHFVVEVGTGRFLDVEGWASADELCARWSSRSAGVPVGFAPWDGFGRMDEWERAECAAAATIAATLVASLDVTLTG